MAVSHLDQLLAQTRSQNEWIEYFGTLKFRTFIELYDKALEKFLWSVKDRETFNRHMPLLVAFARKLLLAAHFMRPASQSERATLIEKAERTFTSIHQLPDEPTRAQLMKVWESTQRYCNRLGYRSGAAFEAHALEKQFKDR